MSSAPPDVELRAATPADAPRLAAIFLRCWLSAYRGVVADEVIDGLEASRVEGWWRDLVERSPTAHELVVATERGRPVGMARFGEGDAGRGHLFSLYVDPRWSGRGIGRALLARAEAGLREAGYAAATLWVFEQNERALRFYRAAGWAPTGERRIEEEWGAPEVELSAELS